MKSTIRIPALAVLAILVFASTAALRAPAPEPSVVPNDMEVAHALVTASDIAIARANLALQSTDDEAIRTYAEDVIATSTANRDSLTSFAAESGAPLAANAWSDSLTAKSEASREEAPMGDAQQFAEWFSGVEADFHSDVATLIETELLPVVEDAGLTAIAQQVQTEATEYADRAKALVPKVTG